MKRRTALKTIGGIAGAAAAPKFLGGCNSDSGEGITTIVAIMMENRSYDHWLGARALQGLGGNGLTTDMSNPAMESAPIGILPVSEVCVADPPHSWAACHAQWNDGANDGFVTTYQASHGTAAVDGPMTYMQRENIPFSWGMADAFTSCDAWYCSLLGPTWPNRMYWHSGTSNGILSNELPEDGFTWPSIYHKLDEIGVDWAYYFSDIPVLGVLSDELETEGRIKRVMWDFFDDAAAGALPPVVYIDPAFSANDDHPPHHPMLGQQFLASIYQALAESPQWENILIVVTYDEHGGFFDHVNPPTTADDHAAQGFDQLGFRVPTLVAGPYVKEGYVSSVTYDHTSVLKHIANMFEMEPINTRTAAANDLTDCIDLERLAAGDPRPPVTMPEIVVDESMIGQECYSGGIASLSPIEEWANRANLPPKWDLRAQNRDLVYGIGDWLERHNRGRIRRGR